MSDEYTCAMCGEEFTKTWSDEEAVAEMEGYFGPVPESERIVICHECFEKVDPAKHPEEVAATRKQLEKMK